MRPKFARADTAPTMEVRRGPVRPSTPGKNRLTVAATNITRRKARPTSAGRKTNGARKMKKVVVEDEEEEEQEDKDEDDNDSSTLGSDTSSADSSHSEDDE